MEKKPAHDFDAFTHFQYHTEYENVFFYIPSGLTDVIHIWYSRVIHHRPVFNEYEDASSEKKGPSQGPPKSNFDFLEMVVTILVIFQ
jgi:hypothetical protein